MPTREYGYRGGQLLVTMSSGDDARLTRFVYNLYYGALQRDPTSQELQDKVNQLAAAGVQGQSQLLTTAKQIARSLFIATAFETSPYRSDVQYVTDLYYTYLQRGPDSGGLGWWVSQVPGSGRENVLNALLELIPEGSVIPPGTELGQLVGTAQGMFSDFVWVNPWTLLARPEALEELRKTDVRLPKSVPALLDFKKANVRTLVELELESRGVLARSSFTEALIECEGCGRIQAKMPERIVVEEALVPSGVDIFRDLIMTTLILATERFVAAVKELKLTGLEFQEVEVA